jgi:hypothetical protein
MSDSIKVDHYMGTGTFFVSVQAKATKTTYRGQFKVKCLLSALDYINSDAYFRELLGKTNPEYANEYVTQLCYTYSQLRYRVMEAPDWFSQDSNGTPGGALEDNVLTEILDQCVKVEEKYRTEMEAKYEKAKGTVKKAIDDGELNNGEEKVKEEDQE